jgi:hypothetical protein
MSINQEMFMTTGYEAYRDEFDDPPKIRTTTKVNVVIRYSDTSPKGYIVQTAYPNNKE